MLARRPKLHTKNRYKRSSDPYWDRRSGEDIREYYTPAYFANDGTERRDFRERRKNLERRRGYVRVSTWSSMRCQP